MIEVLFLLILIFLAALVAVSERSMFSTDVAFGFVGVLLCVAFFVLRAPEVAIAQLIVELLIFIIMIRASGMRRDIDEPKNRLSGIVTGAFMAAAVAVIGFFLMKALYALPPFGTPVPGVADKYIELARGGGQHRNVVTSVLLEYRLFDTVAQMLIIFASMTGIMAVLRKKGRKKIEERDELNS